MSTSDKQTPSIIKIDSSWGFSTPAVSRSRLYNIHEKIYANSQLAQNATELEKWSFYTRPRHVPTTFHRFSELPAELQLQIFRYALPEQCLQMLPVTVRSFANHPRGKLLDPLDNAELEIAPSYAQITREMGYQPFDISLSTACSISREVFKEHFNCTLTCGNSVFYYRPSDLVLFITKWEIVTTRNMKARNPIPQDQLNNIKHLAMDFADLCNTKHQKRVPYFKITLGGRVQSFKSLETLGAVLTADNQIANQYYRLAELAGALSISPGWVRRWNVDPTFEKKLEDSEKYLEGYYKSKGLESGPPKLQFLN